MYVWMDGLFTVGLKIYKDRVSKIITVYLHYEKLKQYKSNSR